MSPFPAPLSALEANAAGFRAAHADLHAARAAGSAWNVYQCHKRLALLHAERTAYFHAHPLAPPVPCPLP